MNLSIFSSEKSYQRQLVIFGISLILMFSTLASLNCFLLSTVEKKAFDEDMRIARHWKEKIKPDSRYAVLFLGDSRMYRGVNPKIVSRILGLKCYNLGFSAGGLNREIFRLAETKLVPASPRTVIVLGITPLTLSAESRSNEHYQSLLTQKTDLFDKGKINETDFLYPMNHERWSVIRSDLKQKESPATLCEFGFLSTAHPFSKKRYENGLQLYRNRMKNYHFSPESLTETANAVKEWKKRGFHVFAFRPPTSAEMEKIENTAFDEVHVRKVFEEAGGIWLGLPANSYQTYDASHLTTESAERFSSDLAKKLQRCLSAGSPRQTVSE